MQIKYKLLLLFSLFISTFHAQENAVDQDSTDFNEMRKIEIPTLDYCINAAIEHSPLLKATDAQVEKLLEELKIQKKSWTNYVYFDANSKYGLFNQIQIEQANPDLPDIGLRTARQQFNYFGGLTIKLPLSVFLTNKNEKKAIMSSVKEAELKREELKMEVSRIVITEYFYMKAAQEKMMINQNNVQATRFDYLKATNDLAGNFINVTEYASISTSYTKATEAYITSKNEFYAKYYLMKLLIGTYNQTTKK